MRVNLSDVAPGGVHAQPASEGSRIRKDLSLDREKELLRGGPNRVDCLPRRLSVAAAPCARGTTLRRFQPQRIERALNPGGVASY
jgi:hypothetical protein